MQELAEKGRCVIIGRCADQVLHNRPNTLKVFLHTPEYVRKERIMNLENLSEGEALQKIHKMDKRRSDNYSYYTRRIWGGAQNYDLTLDSSIGAESVITIITTMLHIKHMDA